MILIVLLIFGVICGIIAYIFASEEVPSGALGFGFIAFWLVFFGGMYAEKYGEKDTLFAACAEQGRITHEREFVCTVSVQVKIKDGEVDAITYPNHRDKENEESE